MPILETSFPEVGSPRIHRPTPYRWPNFLKRDNLLNITNQIAVIAIIAIGMTTVIISGGIDLSVGSLIAFSAVLACLLIREVGGALDATAIGMTLACLGALWASAAIGGITGGLITFFGVPPFIVTLGMMLMASGAAYLLSGGESVYQVPDRFVWLGRGTTLGGLPIAVLLMILLYLLAHFMMGRTRWGRYLYAVGGNAEAARLSGVPVKRIQLSAYVLSGALAGLGGVIMASQLKSGAPTYGQMYELYVIAAVVVGGTSLSGGEGKILGTLIGAFIIAVIQNGMNLMNIEPYTQKSSWDWSSSWPCCWTNSSNGGWAGIKGSAPGSSSAESGSHRRRLGKDTVEKQVDHHACDRYIHPARPSPPGDFAVFFKVASNGVINGHKDHGHDGNRKKKVGGQQGQIPRAKPCRVHKARVSTAIDALHADVINHVAGKKKGGGNERRYHASLVTFFLVSLDGHITRQQ